MGDAIVLPQQVVEAVGRETGDGARDLFLGRRRRQAFDARRTAEGGGVVGEGAGRLHLGGAPGLFLRTDDGGGRGRGRGGGGDDLRRIACGFGLGQGLGRAAQVGDLQTGEDVGPRGIEAGVGRGGRNGLVAGLLGRADQAVRQDVGVEPGPAFLDHGQIGRAIQEAVVHPPGQRIDVEGRARGLRFRIALGVKEAGAPQAVVLLQFGDARGHLLEEIDVELAAREARRHGLEPADETAHDPAVGARPVDAVTRRRRGGSRP